MKKIFIYLIIALLVISNSLALIVETPLPKITTSFNEPILISSLVANLYDSNEQEIYIELINISLDNKTIQHQPIEYLTEGSYYFSVQAEDIYGNTGDIQTQPFTLTTPPLSISLKYPIFGVSPINPFNIIIETNLPSECSYAFVPKEYENMDTYLSNINDFDHALTNFNLGSTNTIYFACFSSYKNETTSNSFEFSIDTSTPEITSIFANDVAELPLETILTVQTDSQTICAYHKNSTVFSEMNIFENLNDKEIESYTISHSHLLNSNDLIDLQTNTFLVICKNLAGTISIPKTISIDVSSRSETIITINSPKSNSYHPAGQVVLNLTSNKLANCHFSNNQEEIIGSGGTFGTFTKDHETTLSLNEGEYTYYFQCLVNAPGILDPFSTQFIVDNTIPNLIYVDDSSIDVGMENLSEFTYHQDKLFVEISADDNESGILAYNYSIWQDNSDIFEPDTTIFNWTFLESDDKLETILIENLKLIDGKKYYFKVLVQNGAGMWSIEKNSNGINVNVELGNLGYCYNNIQDGTETDVDCGGSCPQCSDQKSCSKNEDCQSNLCDPYTKLCKSFTTCSNGYKDGTESDTDCGGQCESCISGESCYLNADCQSNLCDPYTKLCIASTTCDNDILDFGESDTDCGGSCPTPCSVGEMCVTDFDCQSAYCVDGLCAAANNCNNGQFDIGEQCDSETNINCELFGLASGDISCNGQCFIDTSLCLGDLGICGDNKINPGEQCDGSDLGETNCYDFGDYQSGQLSCQNCQLVMDRCTTTLNPLQDTDNDGMSDACELKYFNCRTCADPDADPDNDKLINKEECLLCSKQGTDPNNPDTDNDGHSDYTENNKGTSPCNSEDYPKSPLLGIIIIIIILLILGWGYYLYKKGTLIITKRSPYIELNKNVKSFKDLFNPPNQTKLNKAINHEDYMHPQQVKDEQESKQPTQPTQQQIQQAKVMQQQIRKKQLSIRKTIRGKKRKSMFESFGNLPQGNKKSKNNQEFKLLRKLKLRNNKKTSKNRKVTFNKPLSNSLNQETKYSTNQTIKLPKDQTSKQQNKQTTKQANNKTNNEYKFKVIKKIPLKHKSQPIQNPTNFEEDLKFNKFKKEDKFEQLPHSKSKKKLFKENKEEYNE